MWNLKRNDTKELIYKTETDSQTWRTNLWLVRGKMRGRDNCVVCDGHVNTSIFNVDNK